MDRFHQVRGLIFMAVLSEKIMWYDKQVIYIKNIVKVLREEQVTREIDPDGKIHRDLT